MYSSSDSIYAPIFGAEMSKKHFLLSLFTFCSNEAVTDSNYLHKINMINEVT